MCETRNTNIWAVLVGYYCLLCVLCLEPKGVSVSVCVWRNRFLIIEACGGDYVQCSNDLVVVGDRREQMQIILFVSCHDLQYFCIHGIACIAHTFHHGYEPLAYR